VERHRQDFVRDPHYHSAIMQAQFPIAMQPVVNLEELGIAANAFRFGNLTMESDKYISVKDAAADGSAQVVVIDMHNNNAVTKKPMKAEASLMNTVDNIIALKGKTEGQAGHFIQVFNLDTKEKLGAHHVPENVVFWRWLEPRLLALVTDRSVYHWKLVGTTVPEKIFDRGGKLAEANTQIINYAANSQGSWCLLTAISTPDGGRTIEGSMQLYSVERKQQQLLEGHAGCFGNIRVTDGPTSAGLFAFSERKHGSQQTRLHIMDVTTQPAAGQQKFKVSMDVQMPQEAPTDFAVAMQFSEKYGVLYMLTKAGFMYLFDSATANLLFRHRVSQDTLFIAAPNSRNGGVLFVNKRGQVMTATVNEQNLVPYVNNSCAHIANRQQVAFGIAQRYGLPGADEAFLAQFQRCFATGDYKGAARVAAQAKSGALRTPETIKQFQNAQSSGGQSPILQYFSTLLEYGKLNALESVELVRPVVAQQRTQYVEKWLTEDKLECTEELGDIVKTLDANLGLSIYVRAGAHQKAINCFIETGQVERAVAYAKKVGYQADFSMIMRNMVATNPEAAVPLAKNLLDNKPPLVDINVVVEVFLQHNKLQEITSILLDALKANLPEQAHLQTKLLEMNIMNAPQVAEAIFQMRMFTHYDKKYIGSLCEKAGLYQRAMEHYTETPDIKRCLAHSHTMSPEFLKNLFGQMSPEAALECMHDLLRTNRQNLQTVVQAATQYHDHIGTIKLVEMFESFSSHEGVFYFLGAILASSNDADVHFKYIQAAARLGHVQEVERVCRESTVYDPVEVKNFLKEAKLADARPLIYVCDLHGFINELAEYLYKNNLLKYIEVYVTKVNPMNAPGVVGTLIDLDCSEDFVKTLLQSVRAQCPCEPLVAECEKRHRLRLLLPWLEARVAEGNQEVHLHNALAKIYIDTNRDPESFLKTNAFYDSAVVGRYCEDRDPHLAYTSYKRAWGTCDNELVNVTNKNGLFRLQARYLVERQSMELWTTVLDVGNEHRRAVIDQVVSTALPESTNPDEVSATVKAFIQADLPNELIELLEKIVLHSSDFSGNRNLQNLLILTAIKADKTRVMDYINRLDNYDGDQIAQIALGDDYQLYEEAFLIYKKCGNNAEAMETLLTNIESIERASEFAARCNEPEVWYKLGKAQLQNCDIPGAIDSYLKAEDPRDYKDVIAAAEREEAFDELVRFLRMARKSEKDQYIDSELVYALAKTDSLAEMEEFIGGTNTADVQRIGDRLYDERFFKAAKILFQSIPNNARLASCFVQLGEFQLAVDAAKKANNPKTWKEVNTACVSANEFRMAQMAGMHIIVHPDHLEELIMHYEKNGHFEELMMLLENGLGNERAHIGMYTELGVLYAKYKPEKLMDFIKMNSAKLNIPKVSRACERHYHWKEAVQLNIQYDEFDTAANTMIAHSPTAWTHEQFLSVMQKVSNMELYYRAVAFYLEEQPMQINSLLNAIVAKVDHARVVQQMQKTGHLALILPYLKQVQHLNISIVNEAINGLYIDAHDFEALRESIEGFDNFDQIGMAQVLEKHQILEGRRIATMLYRGNKRYKQAIDLAKQDKMYQDAMVAARDSGNVELCESLLSFFVDLGDKESFAACLYVCYDLLRPDVVLELAWRNKMTDFSMPYMIQVMREMTSRLDALDRKEVKRQEQAIKQESSPNDFQPDYHPVMNTMLPGMGNLAIGMGPTNPQMGMGMPPTGMAVLGMGAGMQQPQQQMPFGR